MLRPESILDVQRWGMDRPLLGGLLLLAATSLLVLYSASDKNLGATLAQTARLGLGFGIMFVFAQVRPETWQRWTPYIFAAGLTLLLIVLAMGAISKGAQRWINLGIVRFQPSEIMKLAMPMMVAWYMSQRAMPPRGREVLVAGAIILLPPALVALQPDLGTALMITASGVIALFLAGLGWIWITGLLGSAAIAAPLLWHFYMHDYQKQRVLTLFDPESDPLGSGYHTIQSTIAVGSGGLYGKGWLNGSQAHLDFLPESSTDFIFAVYAEEFGFLGAIVLLSLYVFVVGRGLQIAYLAQDTYTRLLAGSLSLTFFLYAFVNVGMVTGVLPVVGVPLPVVSYGGSSIVTLMAGFGMLMSIQANRKLVQG